MGKTSFLTYLLLLCGENIIKLLKHAYMAILIRPFSTFAPYFALPFCADGYKTYNNLTDFRGWLCELFI